MKVKVKLKAIHYAQIDEEGKSYGLAVKYVTGRTTVSKVAKELPPECHIYKVEEIEGVAEIPVEVFMEYIINDEEDN